MKDSIYIVIIIILIIFGLKDFSKVRNIVRTETVVKTDTVYKTDTFKVTIEKPTIVEKIKTDTIILTELNVYRDTVYFPNLKIHYQAQGYLDRIDLGVIDTRETITKEITTTNYVSPEGLYLGAQGGIGGFNVGVSYLKGRFIFSGFVGQSSNVSIQYKL